MPIDRSSKQDAKVASLLSPPRHRIKRMTRGLTDQFLDTQRHLSGAQKWAISTGNISHRELDTLLPELVQGNYVRPQIAKHISTRHRSLEATYLSSIIREFVEKLCFSDTTANPDHITQFANGMWTPTLNDFRYDWRTSDSPLNREAIRVVTQGILSEIDQGRFVEDLLDEPLTFPFVNRKVREHFIYLRKKAQKASAENDKGIEADVDEKQRARRCERRKTKYARRIDIANSFKGEWGVFLPFLATVGPQYMSDEESDQDISGDSYLVVRTLKFRPPIFKKLFDCLDELAQKRDERRRESQRRRSRPKYERCPAEDGVPSRQLPPPFLPRDCYAAEWLAEDLARENLFSPAPDMGIRQLLEGLRRT